MFIYGFIAAAGGENVQFCKGWVEDVPEVSEFRSRMLEESEWGWRGEVEHQRGIAEVYSSPAEEDEEGEAGRPSAEQ